ncbi:hypothetical protein M0802_007234 [Mischocyttarus mexicanus]|nr:hypothetical protein M0802_007234 [Mischocyttarus mexicanus]
MLYRKRFVHRKEYIDKDTDKASRIMEIYIMRQKLSILVYRHNAYPADTLYPSRKLSSESSKDIVYHGYSIFPGLQRTRCWWGSGGGGRGGEGSCKDRRNTCLLWKKNFSCWRDERGDSGGAGGGGGGRSRGMEGLYHIGAIPISRVQCAQSNWT